MDPSLQIFPDLSVNHMEWECISESKSYISPTLSDGAFCWVLGWPVTWQIYDFETGTEIKFLNTLRGKEDCHCWVTLDNDLIPFTLPSTLTQSSAHNPKERLSLPSESTRLQAAVALCIFFPGFQVLNDITYVLVELIQYSNQQPKECFTQVGL